MRVGIALRCCCHPSAALYSCYSTVLHVCQVLEDFVTTCTYRCFANFFSVFIDLFVSDDRYVQVHLCPVCEKPFGKKFNMEQHMKIHSGVKAFTCKICAKSFTLKGNLKKHMIVHLNAKKSQWSSQSQQNTDV